MDITIHRRIKRVVIVFLLALLPLPAAFSHADAHGQGRIVYQGVDGSFEITVRIHPKEPAVGLVHFSITPLDPGTKALILGCEVNLIAVDPEGTEVYQSRALNSPLSQQYYDANLTIGSSGEWTVRVEALHEERGTASFIVPLSIAEPMLPSSATGGFVLLGVVAFLISGVVYLCYQSKRRLRTAP